MFLLIREDINASAMDQVAAIWQDGSDEKKNKFKRSIMIFPNSGGPQFIQAYHGCYNPLEYPILYPGGETGWEDKSILLEETPTVCFPQTRRKYTKRKSEVQGLCEEQGDCDDNMDEDGEGGVLCHMGMLYRCLSSGAWVREIAVKDHSRVVFLRILTDFTDTSFRMLLNSCANRSCVIATKVIVDQFTAGSNER